MSRLVIAISVSCGWGLVLAGCSSGSRSPSPSSATATATPAVSSPASSASAPTAASGGAGLAAQYVQDAGLASDPQVVFFEGFESGTSPLLNAGRRIVTDPSAAAAGLSGMESMNRQGSHDPYNTYASIPEADTYYYRFYTRFEPGYDFGGGVKGPGIAASPPSLAGGGGAGIAPTGTDKFGARVCYHSDGAPYIYYYHMDMGQWGSNGNQNVGTPIQCVPGQWYAIEMMLKANDPGVVNGEIMLWIDGQLKAHHQNIRWRTVDTLKINYVNHSAYFGGSWTSPKDQVRYDDNLAVANSYIGMMRAKS